MIKTDTLSQTPTRGRGLAAAPPGVPLSLAARGLTDAIHRAASDRVPQTRPRIRIAEPAAHAPADPARRLSPGEQQRLSFGRILLRKPALIFLDESTSAMDEGMEHAMYEHVREVLPHCTIVSVGHRSSLERLHADELTLLGDGRWESRSLDQGAAQA